jgi:hypothetical protein
MTHSLNKEIAFDSPLHKKLVKALRARKKLSQDEMEKRYPTWRKIERENKLYISAEQAAETKKSRPDNNLEIKVPFSWAMLQTALMYYTSVFFGRSPILQLTGRHGESQENLMGMESLLDYQVNVGEHMRPLYTWLSDTTSYGLGVLGTYWDKETINVSRIVEEPQTLLGMPIEGKVNKKRIQEEVTGYEGNRSYNVRPFDWLPDPRVTIRDYQKGEFCGRKTTLSYNDIIKGQKAGQYFNASSVKRVIKENKGGFVDREIGNTGEEFNIPDVQSSALKGDIADTGFCNVLEMYVELIPEDWGLGKGEYPEKWVFTLVEDKVLIGARPFGMYHNKFPFNVLEYEIEGYNTHARGMTEIIEPMNDVLNWMFNSHIYNVRKTLNNELLIDPSRFVMKDFKRPGAGRMIRLKPTAYGTDPKTGIHQLNMNDVTRGHLNDIRGLRELMQMIPGINDALMGMMHGGGRKTAAEVRTSSSFGVNRLKMNVEYFAATGFRTYAQTMIQSTQQLYDGEKQFKIAGNMIGGQKFIEVTPESISGFYDYVPVDGTMPIDRDAQAGLFKELLMGLGKMPPQIVGQWDFGKILEHIMHLQGVRNTDQFKAQMNVMPNQQIQNGAAKGNLVPLEQGIANG